MAKETAWKPFNTAPKDGTVILARCKGYYPLTIYWDSKRRIWIDSEERNALQHPDGESECYWNPDEWANIPE